MVDTPQCPWYRAELQLRKATLTLLLYPTLPGQCLHLCKGFLSPTTPMSKLCFLWTEAALWILITSRLPASVRKQVCISVSGISHSPTSEEFMLSGTGLEVTM